MMMMMMMVMNFLVELEDVRKTPAEVDVNPPPATTTTLGKKNVAAASTLPPGVRVASEQDVTVILAGAKKRYFLHSTPLLRHRYFRRSSTGSWLNITKWCRQAIKDAGMM